MTSPAACWTWRRRYRPAGSCPTATSPSTSATGGPRQVGRVMALWGGGVPWWRVVHADGSLLAGHEREALSNYRAEGTPLRPATDGAPSRVDMRRLAGTATPAGRPGTGGSAAMLGCICRWPLLEFFRHGNSTRLLTGWSAGRCRPPGRRGWTRPSARWSATPAGRCWYWPARAPARPRRSSRRWPSGSPRRGTDPGRVLVLTFSRKAAQELRERITMRLGRTTREPLALTFHSYAYALVRREFVLAGDEPPTLLSGPSSCWRSAGCSAARRRTAASRAGRSGSGRRSAPGGSPPSCATSCSARPSAAWTAAAWPGWAGSTAATTGRPQAASSTGTPRGSTSPRCPPTTTPRSSGSPAALLGRARGPGPGAARLRRRPGRRVPGHRPGAGGAAARAGRRRPRADRRRRPGPVDLRLPRRRHPRDHALPRPLPRAGRPARPGDRAAHLPPQRARSCWPRRGGWPRRLPAAGAWHRSPMLAGGTGTWCRCPALTVARCGC